MRDDPEILPPKRGLGAVESGSLSSEAEILTGRPSNDGIDSGENVSHGDASDGADVIIPGNVRPMLREHDPPELFLLDLPDTSTSRGVLDSKVQTADARK